jgi:hypothetical protein
VKVIVFQSHAKNPPIWIRRCTLSVREWTKRLGWNYRLLGDELFRGVPLAISLKARSRLPLADLGRLLWAKRLLQDWDRVIWLDSDVLVFDPNSFGIATDNEDLVCREILIQRRVGSAEVDALFGHNPTALMFGRKSPLLDEWLQAIENHAARSPGFGDADFGREMLAGIARKRPLTAIESIGHFNAAILREIHGSSGAALRKLMECARAPLAAGNLCGHYRLPPKAYDRIIDRLIDSRGDIVNAASRPGTT